MSILVNNDWYTEIKIARAGSIFAIILTYSVQTQVMSLGARRDIYLVERSALSPHTPPQIQISPLLQRLLMDGGNAVELDAVATAGTHSVIVRSAPLC